MTSGFTYDILILVFMLKAMMERSNTEVRFKRARGGVSRVTEAVRITLRSCNLKGFPSRCAVIPCVKR